MLHAVLTANMRPMLKHTAVMPVLHVCLLGAE